MTRRNLDVLLVRLLTLLGALFLLSVWWDAGRGANALMEFGVGCFLLGVLAGTWR